ncbi:MAG: hypothetical protein V4505_19815 [Pseudomonadota bacterium]
MPCTAPQPDGAAPASPDTLSDATIPALVAEVYASAPAAERCHILETLIRPLSVLSLVAIAHGIFAKIRFRSAGHELHVGIDDLPNVHAADMVALVRHAQEVSVEAVDSLVQWLSFSGGTVNAATAALLISLLIQRALTRHGTPPQGRDPLDA